MCVVCSAAVAAIAFAPVAGATLGYAKGVFSAPLHRRAVRDYRAGRFPAGLPVPSWADSNATSAFAPEPSTIAE